MLSVITYIVLIPFTVHISCLLHTTGYEIRSGLTSLIFPLCRDLTWIRGVRR